MIVNRNSSRMKQSKNIIRLFENVVWDETMLPSHISMYVSLLQLWSTNQFLKSFRIHRDEVMKLSRIRSLATYHRCIRQLDTAGLIDYAPSYDPYKGSLVEIIEDRDLSIRKTKTPAQNAEKFVIPDLFEVELYFTERDLSSFEAKKFFNYYELQNWNVHRNKPMSSWQAAARNWISKQQKQVLTHQ
ncbi:MAG: hypothetical protein DI539_28590 [Flavobacterium psychrophilum]|nr:MAG: hypothetical protein DI539_28590 [Flavobacterium psychrophilum]